MGNFVWIIFNIFLSTASISLLFTYCLLFLIICALSLCARLVCAERLFFHIISCKGIRPCPTPSAYLSKLAVSASAEIIVPCPHLFKDLGCLPYFTEWLFTYISTLNIQKPAYLNFAGMRHKGKRLATHAPFGHGVEAVGLRLYRDPFFPFVLSEYPVIMRRTGGFELDRQLVPHIVKPCQGLFVICRRYLHVF